MGGRGSFSGAGGGGGYMAAAKNANAKRVDGKPPTGKEKEAAEIINAANKVLKDFGINNGIHIITFYDDRITKDGIASMNGFGDLTISNKHLANPPKEQAGWSTAASNAGTGAHEAGHRVAHILLRKSMQAGIDFNTADAKKEAKIADARLKGKMEKRIIREATKRYGSNPSISKYGDKNVKEKVAEAVSDVYTNGKKANAYSKVIVNVMKDINNGKFKPRI